MPSHEGDAVCQRVILHGEVEAGKSFEQMFARGLAFKLEAIASGWIVRVLPEGLARGPHDYAEIATPPYNSVTPLAISTDFSFRAQDAVGWNPRRFRYAATPSDFAKMMSAFEPAMNGDAKAVSALAALTAEQPEALLTIEDAHLIPGANDQAAMAAAVASHFATTQHEVDQNSGRQALGRVTALRFRVAFDLRAGVVAAPGVEMMPRKCDGHPTSTGRGASYAVTPVRPSSVKQR